MHPNSSAARRGHRRLSSTETPSPCRRGAACARPSTAMSTAKAGPSTSCPEPCPQPMSVATSRNCRRRLGGTKPMAARRLATKDRTSAKRPASPQSARSAVNAQRMSAVCATTSVSGAVAGRPGGLNVEKAFTLSVSISSLGSRRPTSIATECIACDIPPARITRKAICRRDTTNGVIRCASTSRTRQPAHRLGRSQSCGSRLPNHPNRASRSVPASLISGSYARQNSVQPMRLPAVAGHAYPVASQSRSGGERLSRSSWNLRWRSPA